MKEISVPRLEALSHEIRFEAERRATIAVPNGSRGDAPLS